MNVTVSETKQEMGRRASRDGAARIRGALDAGGRAAIVLATGASQFEMLDHLVGEDVDWSRVTAFHLDEYIGMSADHPASFRRYLQERFVDRLPMPLGEFQYIDAEKDPEAERARLNARIAGVPIDVAFVGIGENGHLAFNDPPADLHTEEPYIIVRLDDACRRQQLGEGWFRTLPEVPERAISMSIRQIMKARAVICTAPDGRKAEAVERTVTGPVTPLVPASILQHHPDCHLYLDVASAARLSRNRV